MWLIIGVEKSHLITTVLASLETFDVGSVKKKKGSPSKFQELNIYDLHCILTT
jgi:hypothetical protein